jgi:hyperosmotically inducible periplasmic protein
MTRRWMTKWIAIAALAPLGCAQSDSGITTAIKTKLAADDDVKAYQIDVDTHDKVVTLNGAVDTTQAKNRAEEIARMQKGVTQVVNNLSVTAAGPAVMPMGDEALTAAVKGKLVADTTVAGLRIDVDSREGVVTLSGTVRSQAEKDQALQLARDTTGVKDVVDRLTISPR